MTSIDLVVYVCSLVKFYIAFFSVFYVYEIVHFIFIRNIKYPFKIYQLFATKRLNKGACCEITVVI